MAHRQREHPRGGVGVFVLAPVTALLFWLMFVAPCLGGTPERCGNGMLDPGEECDDGGMCVGASRAGSRCTADEECKAEGENGGACVDGPRAGWACSGEVDCPGSRCAACQPFGGDGCAANCTLEEEGEALADLRLDSAPSCPPILIACPSDPFFIRARWRLAVGKAREGTIPFVVRTSPSYFAPTSVSTLSCVCTYPSEARTCGGLVRMRNGSPPIGCSSESDCTGPRAMPCAPAHGAGNAGHGTLACKPALAVSRLTARRDCASPDAEEQWFVEALSQPASAWLALSTALRAEAGACRLTTCDERPLPPAATAWYTSGEACAEARSASEEASRACAAGRAPQCSPRGDLGLPLQFASASAWCAPDIGALAISLQLTLRPPACTGDCDGDNSVHVDELIRLVRAALELEPATCPAADSDGNTRITVDEIVQSVDRALRGCESFPLA